MSASSSEQLASMRGRALMFECDDWVVALSAECIERVGFAHELTIRPFDVAVSDESTALVGMTESEGMERPTWDMGVLLGLEEQFESYALINVPTWRGDYRATLLGGRVLTFESVSRSLLSNLPSNLFRTRPGVVQAAFPVERVLPNLKTADGRPGLWLDLRRMWSDQELTLHEQFLAT